MEDPKKKPNTGGSLGNIYTGPASTNPGVLKAQADRRRAESFVAGYAEKAAINAKAAINKASQSDVGNKTSGFGYKLDNN